MQAKHLTILIKPASDLCQMACKYCFYNDLGTHNSLSGKIMALSTAKALLSEIKNNLHPEGHVTFAFQGGEPLLAGVGFYKEFFLEADKLNLSYDCVFQTNGLSILAPTEGEEWLRLFKEHQCLIGLSLDGPARAHDFNRVTKDKKGTHQKTMEAYHKLVNEDIKVNILTVLSPQVTQNPEELIDFYIENKVKYLQLIPCLPPLGQESLLKFKLPGTFLKEFYILWAKAHAPFRVREFDAIFAALTGQGGDPCIFGGPCSPQLVMESDGSMYPCDFYVLPQYCTGNINTDSLDSTLRSPGMERFAADFPPIPSVCHQCKYLKLCKGGCRRLRQAWQPEHPPCPIKELIDQILLFSSK